MVDRLTGVLCCFQHYFNQIIATAYVNHGFLPFGVRLFIFIDLGTFNLSSATFLFLAPPPTPLSLFRNFLHPSDSSAVNDHKKRSLQVFKKLCGERRNADRQHSLFFPTMFSNVFHSSHIKF